MPTPTAASNVSEGLYFFGEMYGSAWRDGVQLAEAIEVTGDVQIADLPVSLVGQTRDGHKPGKETRTGTLMIQKIDTKWEMEIYQFLSQNLATRRANRDKGIPNRRPFQLQLEYDDPDALGIEKWVLDGCLLWALPLGFNVSTDAIVTRQFPLTWEKETPLYAFTAVDGGSGTPHAQWYDGFGPPPGV